MSVPRVAPQAMNSDGETLNRLASAARALGLMPRLSLRELRDGGHGQAHLLASWAWVRPFSEASRPPVSPSPLLRIMPHRPMFRAASTASRTGHATSTDPSIQAAPRRSGVRPMAHSARRLAERVEGDD